MTIPADMPSSVAPPLRRYERVSGGDPERMGGTQIYYANMHDFAETFAAEAADPHVVGAADVLDILNPLQHLPLISSLYRDITGDQIKPGARMIGGAVFGGGVGLASSSVNAVIEEKTGADIGGNLAQSIQGTGKKPTKSADRFVEREPVTIAWNDPPLEAAVETRAETLPHVAAARYVRASETLPTVPSEAPRAYALVRMVDPERSAGSLAHYA